MKAPSYFVVMLTVALPVLAQPESKTPYQLLYAEWKAEEEALDDASPALSAIERRERTQRIRAQFTQQFVELAESNLDDEDVWLRCLLWTVQKGSPGESLDKMFDLLANNVEKVRDRKGLLVGAMDGMPSAKSDRISPTLSLLASRHASERVRGNALFTLANRNKRLAEARGDLAACADTEKHLQRVISEYPKIRNGDGPIAAQAQRLLEDLHSTVAIGKQAPKIQGTTLSGQPFELSDFHGRVTILAFSGHWCAPCVAMHSTQRELMEKYAPRSLRIVEINSDRIDSLEGVKERMTTEGLNWIAVADGPGGPITKRWRIRVHPTYCVIDAKGRIRHRGVGAIGDQLAGWVEALARSEE